MRHLDLLNAFLALRFRQPGYPACLDDLGYAIHSIGVTIQLSNAQRIAPDAIASHPQRNVTLLVEVKSGASVDGDQLQRMLAVKPADLRDYAYLPIEGDAAHRGQVVYVCDEQHRLSLERQVGNRPAAILGFDGIRFRASGAALVDAELSTCLARSEVKAGALPLAIIPFDRESPDEEVARAILPQVVNAWMSGSGTIRADLLVARTHYLVHTDMGSTGSGSELPGVVARAKEVIDALAKAELSEWLERTSTHPTSWKFRKGLPREHRTRELKKLHGAAERYLNNKGSGRAVQLKLFDGNEQPYTEAEDPEE